jgi:hypothetical protein
MSYQLSPKSHSLAESWQPGIETIEQAKFPNSIHPNPAVLRVIGWEHSVRSAAAAHQQNTVLDKGKEQNQGTMLSASRLGEGVPPGIQP